ncbi:hypothetical protein ACFO5R_12695 [Halosolutus amylolyticus]|uniref:DUF8159 domain-containing protein n=1 Tax=Halosolutus amylolyticus TaxID=2932267 RepID=A0ABD5PR68_9EURY|nr:hypothetical protein [Halosolutus amylolyticus]
MERRRLLIGSGAALTTALAGCFGSETDDDSTDPEDGLEDSDGTDDGSGDDNSDGDDNDTGDGNDGDGDDEKYDDVPGFDAPDLSVDSDVVSIDRVERDGATVRVKATTTTTDQDVLYAEFESLARDLERPTYDIAELKQEIDTIEYTINDEENGRVLSFSVRPVWIYKYMNDELTDEEFLDLVRETVE